MELKIIFLGLPSFLVVVGWFFVNHLTSKREHKSKNREIRYSYLSKAHRAISSIAHRDGEYTDQQKADFEEAIENIQIFGSEDQIKVLKEVLASDERDFNKIILKLRNEIRESLDLKENNSVIFYRIN